MIREEDREAEERSVYLNIKLEGTSHSDVAREGAAERDVLPYASARLPLSLVGAEKTVDGLEGDLGFFSGWSVYS